MPSGGALKGRRKKKRRSRFRRYFRKFTVFFFSHVGLAAVSVAYMLVGAIIFKYIEAPHELGTRQYMHGARRRLKDLMWKVVRDNNTALDKHLIADLLLEHATRHKFATMTYIRRGYDGRQQVDNVLWSLSGAFFYCLTTISTVGYGNIACRTTVGRAVTILYSIFGIPLMLLFLAVTGDTFSITCKFVYRAYVRQRIRFIQWRHRRRHCVRVNSALSRLIREQLYHTAAMYGIIPPARVNEALLEEGRQEVKEVTVPIFVLTVIMVAYLVAGATLFCLWESWTFEEGFYFCFVSLALIGFGDLFPGKAVIESWEARNRIIICALYLLFGMALIAMCFNLAQEDMIRMVQKCAHKIRVWRGTAGKLTRQSSRVIDPRDVIIEGGPIGGPNESPPLTLGDVHAALTAAEVLTKSQKEQLPLRSHSYRSSTTSCDTPQSSTSAPVMTENTRLLMPNGNPSQAQHNWGAISPSRLRRRHEPRPHADMRLRLVGSDHWRANDYQFI